MRFLNALIFKSTTYVDESGKTALMWAVERGHLKVVEYLLEHPLLDVNIKAIAQEWVLNLKAISQILDSDDLWR